MAMPRPRTSPGLRRTLGARLAGAAGGRAAAAVLAGGSALPLRLEDLGDRPLLRVEELVVHPAPAAELVDLEECRRGREVVRAGHPLAHRPVALPDEDLLGLGCVEEVDERLRRRRLLRLVDDRDRVLDENRLVGDDVVELLALLLREDRLVLVSEEDVALTAREGLQRLACALVEHRHVLEELRDVFPGLLGRPALLELGAVGRHYVPLRAAG